MNTFLPIIQEIKADEYSCARGDFSASDGTIFVPSKDTQFKMISFGKSTVMTGEASTLTEVRNALNDAKGIDCFDAPSLFKIGSILKEENHTLSEINDSFIPSEDINLPRRSHDTYELVKLLKEEIKNISNKERFENALCLDDDIHLNEFAYAAIKEGQIVSLAGVSSNTENLWWVGVDTLSPHRQNGLATLLVNSVSRDVISQNKIPLYVTWYSNIASRLTAIKAGFRPGFVEILSDQTAST